MKIALVSEFFPPILGGQEIRFAEIADELATRGHDVVVFTVKVDPKMADEERLPSGVRVIRSQYLRNYRRTHSRWLPRSVIGMIRYAWASRRWLQQSSYDAIFLNQWPWLHVVALTARDRKRSIIDWCEIRSSQPYAFFQDILPRMVAANSGVSDAVTDHIANRSKKFAQTISSGVFLNRYHCLPIEERSGILYVGRLWAHKGIPMVVAAYGVLRANGYDEPLTIAGSGPEESTIRTRIAESPYAKHIHMTGSIFEDEKIALLAKSKVLMLASNREGFPKSVVEAMASGLPTVTAQYPGNGTVQIVEQFHCGLTAPPTPEALAEAVQNVIAHWADYSSAARREVKQLDMSGIITNLETLMKELAVRGGGLICEL
jgi:glycosyltransferase involved in cell wall biosynthesis